MQSFTFYTIKKKCAYFAGKKCRFSNRGAEGAEFKSVHLHELRTYDNTELVGNLAVLCL